MTDRAAPSALSATAGHPPGLGSSLLFLSVSRKKKLTKRKAADYASVATPAILPAIRHANSLPHVAAQTGASLHAVRTASASRPGC